ncbi:MAG: methyltransferase domain-containing protein [Desulfovibrio sp.]|nr:methyltransferase domain-containing protein [Desulfovibrio sp.]MBI4959120.1 methyltransferase domain-containing protein [Desulfovibrio sp.]
MPEQSSPPFGKVLFGDLRRTTPISRVFGLDRGTPIDLHYIARFLESHTEDVRGRVLEIAEDSYSRRFGGEHVSRCDVLHVGQDAPPGAIIADITSVESGLESDAYDCIILTQTLLVIYDLAAALTTLKRILRPGGVILASVPGISQISRYDYDRWGDFWRFTDLGVRRLFEDFFSPTNVSVQTFGNVLTSVSFLHGIVTEELTEEELAHIDPDYQLLIAIRAVKNLV